jgi:hypothetical protein
MIQRIRQWLGDTYNGLYVIVLKPHMPSFVTVLALVLALLFGIFWAYVVRPIEYYDGAPFQMSEAGRDQWIKLVAGSYVGGLYDDQETFELLSQVENPAQRIDVLIPQETGAVQAALTQIQPIAQQVGQGTLAPRPGELPRAIFDVLLPIILLIILALIISPIWRLLFRPNVVDTIYDAVRPKSQAELEARKQAQADRQVIRQRKEEEQRLRQDTATAAATNPYGAPVMQKLSIYTKGRAYDDSFAIEDANDVFLGECGATIAKTIGDTNEPTAVEVWLFDKEDFVRTLNKLFVSEHAYNDPMLRADLEARVDNPATDIVVARPGAILTLQTDALLLQAKVNEVTYGSNGILPPNSYFEALKLQIETWQKSGVPAGAVPQPVVTYNPAETATAQPITYTVPASAPTTPAATYTPPAYTPPAQPAQPTQPVQPAAPLYTPPPPPPSTLPEDDDPFGGTGDFTPLG